MAPFIRIIIVNSVPELEKEFPPQGIPENEHDQLSTAWGHFWWILSGQEHVVDHDDHYQNYQDNCCENDFAKDFTANLPTVMVTIIHNPTGMYVLGTLIFAFFARGEVQPFNFITFDQGIIVLPRYNRRVGLTKKQDHNIQKCIPLDQTFLSLPLL